MTNNITFIGDSHSKVKLLNRLNLPPEHTTTRIHVGDVSLGFQGLIDTSDLNFDLFIRGNHDDPMLSVMDNKYMGDFGYEEELELFYVSGANTHPSLRHYGDWFPEEELSTAQAQEAIDLYNKIKPRIVVSHDAPFGIPYEMGMRPLSGQYDRNLTANMFEDMFSSHHPEFWVFGHHHFAIKKEIQGTNFVGLGELDFWTLKK